NGVNFTSNHRFEIARLCGIGASIPVAKFGGTPCPVKAGRWPPPSAAAALTGHGVPLRFATKRSTAKCGRAAISNRWFSANFGPLLTDAEVQKALQLVFDTF